MDKLVDAFSSEGIIGLVLLGMFGVGYVFLCILERIFNARTNLIKYILDTHSKERLSWFETITKCLNNHKEDQ